MGIVLVVMAYLSPPSLWATEYRLLVGLERPQELSIPVCDVSRAIDLYTVLVIPVVLDDNACSVPPLGHLTHPLLVLYQDMLTELQWW